MTLAIVVAGGDGSNPAGVGALPTADLVIAADSGLDRARSLGLAPAILVGDLDSISAAGLHWAHEQGLRIDRHPSDKDATDLELALRVAVDLADDIVVIDSSDGRRDHGLGNVLLLGSDAFARARLSARIPGAWVTVVRTERELGGAMGDIVSLFAIGGTAEGVTTTGLRWPLVDADLAPGSTLGISNELLRTRARVAVRDGVVLAVQPDSS